MVELFPDLDVRDSSDDLSRSQLFSVAFSRVCFPLHFVNLLCDHLGPALRDPHAV